MERNVSSQVAAICEDFGYGGYTHHQFLPHKGQAASWLYPRMRSNTGGFDLDLGGHSSIVSSNAQSKLLQSWHGFSFMVDSDHETGSYKLKLLNGDGKDAIQRKRQVDLEFENEKRDISDAEVGVIGEGKRKKSLFRDKTPPQGVSSGSEEAPTAFTLEFCPDTVGDIARNTKRIRPSSPGSQHSVCQVDDCNVDLIQAKDYHRRHKVCELHSKAPNSLVQSKMQRFCQQCSRFHLLNEFDEGKRSCRRRLAGHNKRRRKPPSDITTNVTSLSDVTRSATNVLSIIATLSQPQLLKAKPNLGNFGSMDNSVLEGIKDSIVKPALFADVPQKAISVAVQNLPESSMNSVKGNMHPSVVSGKIDDHCESMHSLFPPPLTSPEDIVRDACNDSNGKYKIDLNGNWDHADNSKAKHTRQYLTDTSFHTEEGNLVSSIDNSNIKSPEEWNFFPTVSGAGFHKDIDLRAKGSVEDSCTHMGSALNLSTHKQQEDESTQLLVDSLDSGSDQSPASSMSGGQELSGRIIFKLCDQRRIADIPKNHRSQLQEWLSVTPCFMEGYMRPGCVVLTIFISMHHHAWKELVTNLRGNLKRLVQSSVSPSDIWKKGRILVQVEQQRALIVNGKVKRLRQTMANRRPLLKSVRPIAVVAGQETTLTVSGYNLVPQTKILCVYNEKYIMYDVPHSKFRENCDESSPVHLGEERWGASLHRVLFPGGPSDVVGRFFVEVEHDLLGNILPVIVADPQICSELRSLEKVLDGDITSDEIWIDKEAEIMKFLHELGWIFQSTSCALAANGNCHTDNNKKGIMINPVHFKGLLSYAVIRDWCAVVNKLLDLMFEMGYHNEEDDDEVLTVLSDVSLIHEAVKRKCRSMVELLLHYKPKLTHSTRFQSMFTPLVKGHRGLTPLHVAASMLGAEEMIEILTNDPNEAGLHGWKSVCDNEGRTPEWHAKEHGNLTYLGLIEAKLSRSRSYSVNISIREIAEGNNGGQEDGEVTLPRMKTTLSEDTRRTTIFIPTEASTMRGPKSAVCKECRRTAGLASSSSSRFQNRMYRPLMFMTVMVAAICAAAALLMKGPPQLGLVVYSLKSNGLEYGPS